jgi:hypothetical protein
MLMRAAAFTLLMFTVGRERVDAEGYISNEIYDQYGTGVDLDERAFEYKDGEEAFWDRYDDDDKFRQFNNMQAMRYERAAEEGSHELQQELAEGAARKYTESGIDVLHYPNQVEGGDAFIALPSSTIRSIFARFDPRLKHLRNLSAGVGGGVVLANEIAKIIAGQKDDQTVY